MSSIEQEIQQTVFKSINQKVLLNLVYTANWIKASQVRIFKQFGISAEQFNVLRILRGQKGNAIGVNKIQERMLDKNSNASRLIDKLNEKELVDRVGCKNDRRQVEVFITEKGLDLLASLDELVALQEENAINLSHKESEILNELLNKLRTQHN
jgi:DNA-binding MarR family transcriptional regulator